VPGYYPGGKTGTAEKNSGHGYKKHANVSAFMSVFPMQAPRYAVYMMLDEPHGNASTGGYSTAGQVAAPAAGKVISRIGPILGLMPDIQDAAAIEQALAIPLQPARGLQLGPIQFTESQPNTLPRPSVLPARLPAGPPRPDLLHRTQAGAGGAPLVAPADTPRRAQAEPAVDRTAVPSRQGDPRNDPARQVQAGAAGGTLPGTLGGTSARASGGTPAGASGGGQAGALGGVSSSAPGGSQAAASGNASAAPRSGVPRRSQIEPAAAHRPAAPRWKLPAPSIDPSDSPADVLHRTQAEPGVDPVGPLPLKGRPADRRTVVLSSASSLAAE
jgi:hypothetical protein